MSRARRKLAQAWTVVAFTLALCAPGAAVADSQTGHQALSWTPCHTDVGPTFECATAQVPLDYSRPRGATITLALTRLPATDPAHRIGSLFLNPGGPGGSGVDFVLGAGPFLYTDEVRARFDLVGFDPRGIIRSTPLRCFGSEDEWPAFPPFAFPITREQERAVDRRRIARSTAACRAARRPDHATTCRPRTSRATSTCCAGWSATTSSTTPASRTAPTSASRTRTCSRTGCARSWSTACSTRSRGRPAAADRGRRSCRSRRACAATPARRRR